MHAHLIAAKQHITLQKIAPVEGAFELFSAGGPEFEVTPQAGRFFHGGPILQIAVTALSSPHTVTMQSVHLQLQLHPATQCTTWQSVNITSLRVQQQQQQ